ncbi:MAG: hypothetical protein M0023_05170 [Desulfobacteraceae bacterium]|nr:hypothetical protein [Desulfobacteraceae bacterium]
MNIYNWLQYKDEFVCDGSYRDIYVFNTNVAIWQQFLDFLKSNNIAHYFRGEEKVEQLNDLATFFKERAEHGSLILSIDINGVIFNCHFFTETEIDFDIDPKEITDETKAIGVFKFMETIGEALSLPVCMTPENTDETPIFEYTPVGRTWSYFPYYGNIT